MEGVQSKKMYAYICLFVGMYVCIDLFVCRYAYITAIYPFLRQQPPHMLSMYLFTCMYTYITSADRMYAYVTYIQRKRHDTYTDQQMKCMYCMYCMHAYNIYVM